MGNVPEYMTNQSTENQSISQRRPRPDTARQAKARGGEAKAKAKAAVCKSKAKDLGFKAKAKNVGLKAKAKVEAVAGNL